MADLVTAAQMRAIEAAAIAQGLTTAEAMMEEAGVGVVAALLDRWPALATAPESALVLCGPGSNGGDGYVVARRLRQRGWQVRVMAWGDPARLPPAAAAMRRRWEVLGEVEPLAAPRDAEATVRIDALFGTGLTHPVAGDLAAALGDPVALCHAQPVGVAVDMPSGLCSDSGRVLGDWCLDADLTVTFHARKLGHVLGEGPGRCGRIEVAGIGLTTPLGSSDLPVERGVSEPQWDVAVLAEAGTELLKTQGHKYDYGHSLVLCGAAGQGGAARMAARAALRAGAGLVTLCAPGPAMAENAGRLDAVMLARVDGVEDLAGMLEDDRIAALLLGPGLGVDRAAALLPAALGAGRRCVLDADALTALARDEGLRAQLHEGCVLTPHLGEFRRLCPDLADRLSDPATKGPACSTLDAAREAAGRLGCTVLLKGPATVISDGAGGDFVNDATGPLAAPWLATAGAGDVLAGILCGLLARSDEVPESAAAAAALHTAAARAFGPGLIAEDLPDLLPQVFREIAAAREDADG